MKVVDRILRSVFDCIFLWLEFDCSVFKAISDDRFWQLFLCSFAPAYCRKLIDFVNIGRALIVPIKRLLKLKAVIATFKSCNDFSIHRLNF